MRALIIEDDSLTAQSIVMMLDKEGVRSDVAFNGEDGLAYSAAYEYDIILLDLKLGDIDGLDVLKEIRDKKLATPILILSGVHDVTKRVEGLKSGADDYLTKPFDKSELMARINAVVRRASGHSDSVIRAGPLVVDLNKKLASVGDERLDLTASEFAVLEALALRKGGTVTKEAFLSRLYGGLDEANEKIIDVFIHNLRKKIDDSGGDGKQIATVWGRGYMLEDGPPPVDEEMPLPQDEKSIAS